MNTGRTCSTCTEQLSPNNLTGRCAECKLIERNAWAELPDVTP